MSVCLFLDWMLIVFIHSLLPAYLYYCYMTKRTKTLPWPVNDYFWTDLTYWHWGIVWILFLTPLFLVLVVLAGVIRVCRFAPNLNSVQFCHQ